MNEADRKLAQAGTVAADDVAHRGYPAAGIFRRLARRVVELSTENDRLRTALNADAATAAPCPTCLGPVDQPGRGRPRKYCSETCRRNARKRKLVA